MKRMMSVVLSAVLLLSGCAGSGGAGSQGPGGTGASVQKEKEAMKMNYILSQPVYPKFPQQPVMPEEGLEGAWDAYIEAYDKYMDALAALRRSEERRVGKEC